jgi:hypothetical protein
MTSQPSRANRVLLVGLLMSRMRPCLGTALAVTSLTLAAACDRTKVTPRDVLNRYRFGGKAELMGGVGERAERGDGPAGGGDGAGVGG